MRKLVFGLGIAQVLVSAMAIGLAAVVVFGHAAAAALLIGSCLALSSTAMVIELLAQQNRLTSAAGRASFSILLLQDLAVVPILFLAGILGTKNQGANIATGLLQALAQAAIVIVAITAAGRLLLRPLFRLVANTENTELFVAATLFVAMGTGVATQSAGLSMALGAFIAGLLLAETEYRKAIEATVEPFKGLLLGVFFFSVGMLIDISLLVHHPFLILGSTVAMIALKAALLIPLSRAFGLSWPAAIETGLLLGPGGEFAFIVIGLAVGLSILDSVTGSTILTVVALTMTAIPLMAWLSQVVSRKLTTSAVIPTEIGKTPPSDVNVRAIIIGHGRVGRLIAEMLDRHGVSYLATEREPATVTKWRRRGRPIYYGDAKQLAFLRTCGLDKADALILTIHSPAEIEEIITTVRSQRKDILIVARARDAEHARQLYALGVNDAVPETIEASLQLSEAVLVGMGVSTGPVIASIHEKRDEFRHELQLAAGAHGMMTRAIKKKSRQA
jgi:CPA2 family monovalent cation:H+ antiporter-2